MARKKIQKCPKCSSVDVIPIIYGMPGGKMQKDYMEGKIKLGGCSVEIGGKQSNRYCRECQFEWNKDGKF